MAQQITARGQITLQTIHNGVDANLLPWVKEWENGKTVITGDTLITPKIFTGAHNGNGTLTGTAIGRFSMVTRNERGEFQSEVIDGIYGLKDGFKTFYIDNGGSVELGRGDNSIRYDADTGKITFGAAVSMQWIGATYIDANGVFTGTLSADIINALQLNASQIIAGTISADRIDVAALKAELITVDNIEGLTLNFTKGRIGCWTIDSDSIYTGSKSNVPSTFTSNSGFITIGSNGIRGYKWALECMGSGQLAGGNIAWDVNGNVTFGPSVSLYWKNEAQAALDQAKNYTDGVAGDVLDQAAGDATEKMSAAEELARAMAYGRMLYRDPTFYNGNNEVKVFDYQHSGNLTLSNITEPLAPNDSKKVLEFRSTGVTTHDLGGFFFGNSAQYKKVFITRIIARIPVGYSLNFVTNNIGTDGDHKWLTSNAGTGDWTEYIYKIVCGTSNFAATNYFYIAGTPIPTIADPLIWKVAYATVFDITSTEKLTTTIDADGIYTGTLTAQQVNAVNIEASSIKTGFLSADRIAAGSIKADKLDAASIKAAIINTDYINGLELNFQRGKIGGWTIGSDSIYSEIVPATNTVSIQIRTATAGSGYVHSGAYKPLGITLTWNQYFNSGHLGLGQVMATSNTPRTDFFGLQMMSHDNFEYFTLSANVVRYGVKEVYNRIAGWAFDHEKIWKNNVSLGADGSIASGNLWKLNNDGSGQLASGNISWDAAGNVTFSESVILQWGSPGGEDGRVDGIIEALGGNGYPKLTKITSTGIYTGTLTAAQINVSGINAANITTGILSADRIAAGSITVDKLDVVALKAQLITAANINALTLTVNKGTIGGWIINSSSITSSTGTIVLDNVNRRIALLGTGATSTNGQRLQLHHTSATNFGLQVLDASNAVLVNLGYSNSIAGWIISQSAIYKNSVYLGADGSIYNSLNRWRFNNDGSGSVASGNILWTATGDVTFSSSVALNWQTGINLANDLARAMAFGQMLYRAPEFYMNGATHLNGTANYLINCTRTLIILSDSPNSSKYVLRHTVTGWNGVSDLRAGGFCFSNQSRANAIFIVRLIARIPIGRQIENYHNTYGTGGTTKWLTSQDGTGKWEEYICKVTCGPSGTFSTVNHFALMGGVAPTPSVPLIWDVAYATVFDITSSEKMMTTINADGIYTGRISAGQINVDSALVVGGSTYNGSISVRDASNIVKVTLDRTGITAVGGRIGGWYLNATQIYTGAVVLNSDGSIYNSTRWRLNSDGSGQLASGKFSWDAAGNITATGGTFNDVTINGSVRNAFIRYDSAIYVGGPDPGFNFTKYDHAVLHQTGGWNEYFALPWTLYHSGRRLCLLNYRWGASISDGVCSITAPTGKYFYEDGIAKTRLTLSHEVVELMGYGDTATFFGWIVLNRIDLMTTSRYGKKLMCLAEGVVTVNGTSLSYRTRTFEGTSFSVTRSGTGLYYVYLPWSLGATKYYVMATGRWGSANNTPIYPTIKYQYDSYFCIQTQDDPTANDGSFNFQVFSTADWDL